MKLLRRKKEQDAIAATETSAHVEAIEHSPGIHRPPLTAPKGRPTPKRSDGSSTKRGPTVPAPMTAAQARARRKAIAGPKLSRQERQAAKTARRSQMTDRRQRMMAGEEGYLLPRDQGPVRRYVRDVVDSRRNVLGLFLPSLFVLMFVSFGVPQLQIYLSPAMLVLMLAMAVDAVVLSRKISKLVDNKFPSNTESRWKLGLYAAGRASQLRRTRAPRPQVERGSFVA